MPKKVDIELAAKAHTNLNVLAAIEAILESGSIYQTSHSMNGTVRKIIKLCESERGRQLVIYDREKG